MTTNVYAVSHLSGDCSTPNNALGAADATWTTDSGNTSWTSRWKLDDPSSITISGTQTINVFVRNDGGGSSNPSATVELYEDGFTFIGEIVADTTVSSSSGQTLSGTFDASAISDQSLLELQIVTSTGGGNPNNRMSVQVDYIEWAAEGDAGATTFQQGISATSVGQAGASTVSQFARSISATQAGAAALLRNIGKTISATQVGSASAQAVTTFARSISASSVGAVSVVGGQVILAAISATSVGQAGASTVSQFFRQIPATQAGAAALLRNIGKTISATSVGQAGASTVSQFFRQIPASSVGSASVVGGQVILAAISATAAAVSTVTPLIVLGANISAAALATAQVSLTTTYSGVIAATQVAAVSLQKTIGKALNVAAVVQVSTTKAVKKTISASAAASALVSGEILANQAVSAVQAGLAGLSEMFIAGGGGSPFTRRVKKAVKAVMRAMSI